MLALAGVGVGDAETDEASAGVELLEPGRGIGTDDWVSWVGFARLDESVQRLKKRWGGGGTWRRRRSIGRSGRSRGPRGRKRRRRRRRRGVG